jgi:hypothetical protein
MPLTSELPVSKFKGPTQVHADVHKSSRGLRITSYYVNLATKEFNRCGSSHGNCQNRTQVNFHLAQPPNICRESTGIGSATIIVRQFSSVRHAFVQAFTPSECWVIA